MPRDNDKDNDSAAGATDLPAARAARRARGPDKKFAKRGFGKSEGGKRPYAGNRDDRPPRRRDDDAAPRRDYGDRPRPARFDRDDRARGEKRDSKPRGDRPNFDRGDRSRPPRFDREGGEKRDFRRAGIARSSNVAIVRNLTATAPRGERSEGRFLGPEVWRPSAPAAV